MTPHAELPAWVSFVRWGQLSALRQMSVAEAAARTTTAIVDIHRCFMARGKTGRMRERADVGIEQSNISSELWVLKYYNNCNILGAR